MNDILLNVADIRHKSEVNGPGTRSVVWVQGCRRNCPGCINPHTQPHKPVKLLDPEELGRQLADVEDTIGITLSGGEPFEQAQACAVLAETVKKTGKSVMVFTGFPFEQLQQSDEPSVKRFLGSIDLIVAGPYIQQLKCQSRLWRASSNQTVHFLTNSAQTEANLPESPTIEIKTDGDRLSFTGFPDREDLTWLDELGKTTEQVVSEIF